MRLSCLVASVFVFLSLAAVVPAGSHLVAPDLKVGQWVSYSVKQDEKTQRAQTVQIKYSIVGKEKHEGQDCLWHEFEIVRGEQDKTVYRLLLPDTPEAAEETLLCFLSVLPNVGQAKRYILWEPGTDPTEANVAVMQTVNDALLSQGKRVGFAQDEPIRSLQEMKSTGTQVEVKTNKGVVTCDALEARLNSPVSKHRTWRYWACHSNAIPVWGLGKVVYEKTVFGKVSRKELELQDFGSSGATSVVPGNVIKSDMRLGKPAAGAK